jgi:hypothetical protein
MIAAPAATADAATSPQATGARRVMVSASVSPVGWSNGMNAQSQR